MKTGRPPKPPADRRSAVVSFRVRPDQLQAAKDKAADRTISDWARDAFIRASRTG